MHGDEPHSPEPTARDLFAQIRADARADQPAYVALALLLTVGGRVPYQHAVAGLTVEERALLHLVMGVPDLRLETVAAEEPASDRALARDDVLVAYSPQGKLSLFGPAERHLARPDDLLGRIRVGESILEQVEEEAADWHITERHEQARLDRMLRSWEEAGDLGDRVRQVADWIDRVETVLVYCGRTVFSRSDAGTSNLLREGLLCRLAELPLHKWRTEERLFTAAAHLLFAAGRAIRFEEFNGRQLTATSLFAWLVSTRNRYAHATGADRPVGTAEQDIEALAREVAELGMLVDNSGTVRFRRICGLTFAKQEVLVPLPYAERRHGTLPQPVRAFAEASLGLDVDRRLDGEDAVTRIVAEIIARPPGQAGPLLERMLGTMVLSAVVDLDADYGMSSAVRDPQRLASVGPNRVASALTLRKPDFFCCVLPHPTRLDLAPSQVGHMLWLVAQRMQYNRWHFVPGNFDRAEIPTQRHYFFPPTMPDLAESAQFWHGGHVAARVRYSIRAPGAQLWRAPFTAFGNAYRGCYDLRVVRTHGDPFVRRDLWLATRYSGLIDAFWRAVVTSDTGPRGDLPTIEAFDRHWYASGAWKQFTPASSTGSLP
ncbi:hypothetical protein AB0J90_30730 [Micromonospora sp. NPDC049523]|uniref:hypothetical protein n=1 Tax=Micromonospora sp. NPDC049523 TaxID=3155921 RepID=UPI003424AD2C